jgi:uncharacterized protein (TIGR00725 family)
MAKVIGVIGAGVATSVQSEAATEVGRLIARRGWYLVCGGLGGVMEAVARGAHESGGVTIGLLPGNNREAANNFITIPIATGLGEGRNLLIVRAADLLIAIGGKYGTLSEIALALKIGKPVIGLDSWDIPGVIRASSPEDAVRHARKLLHQKNRG